MTIVFYCNYLNHHQVAVADEMYGLLGEEFRFVATLPRDNGQLKGGGDYSSRPYCILAAETDEGHRQALELAVEADVCVFGACSQEYAVRRAVANPAGMAFEVGERWLKRGWLNVASPVLRAWWLNYRRYFRKANFYKLCSGAFVAVDDERLGCYKGRHYKWGYFTEVPSSDTPAVEASGRCTSIMWCARFIDWKHPELAVLLAHNLKNKGMDFVIDMYGSGEYEARSKALAMKLGLDDVVKFNGTLPNEQLMQQMREHSIFLFTSDRNEGWGAVANESLANGCVLIASDAIGSSPYLIKDGVNGYMFRSASTSSGFKNPDKKALADLTDKAEWLINNKEHLEEMRCQSILTMRQLWHPRIAALNLLELIDDLRACGDTSIAEGPCSKA